MIGDFLKSQTYRIYGEYEILDSLIPDSEPSAKSNIGSMYAKTLSVSAGSEFEDWISSILQSAISQRIPDNRFARAIFERNVERKYFQFFDFESANLNKIWAFVPCTGTDSAQAELKGNNDLKLSLSAFMALNRERNRLVHQNFAAASPTFTVGEVMTNFELACNVIQWISGVFSTAKD